MSLEHGAVFKIPGHSLEVSRLWKKGEWKKCYKWEETMDTWSLNTTWPPGLNSGTEKRYW